MSTPRIHHEFPDSTRVSDGWYSPDEKMIEVQFLRDGVRWIFFNCEAETWRRFTTADSPGLFLRDVLERHSNRRR